MCFIQLLTVYFLPLNILILAKCFTVEKLPHDFFFSSDCGQTQTSLYFNKDVWGKLKISLAFIFLLYFFLMIESRENTIMSVSLVSQK